MPKMSLYDHDLLLLLLSALVSVSLSVDSLPAIFKMAVIFIIQLSPSGGNYKETHPALVTSCVLL